MQSALRKCRRPETTCYANITESNPDPHVNMPAYMDITLQDSMDVKDQHIRCKLSLLERKCSNGVEKLKLVIGEHLQMGIPTSPILEKTVSFFTPKKVLLSPTGYSKYSRDMLRLFPASEEDIVPLCFEQ
ncbi:hypothetical protein DPEC_G00205990 [Dallia pectoralis]|uniref:Uncharacterized protein n=1 Tax=Dallia pectoralis TaxID=75939 RepID=A0ACC2G4N9_DALPE|nr:hypothetical protein DPEC_G00205990 [Dallia pectoralis]